MTENNQTDTPKENQPEHLKSIDFEKRSNVGKQGVWLQTNDTNSKNPFVSTTNNSETEKPISSTSPKDEK